MQEYWVGLDISKEHVDVAVADCESTIRLSRTSESIAQWLQSLEEGARLVMEATGGYEQLVVDHAHACGLGVSVVNPRQVRDFAKATGQLAKTDKLDARVLALFGQRLQPRLTLAKSLENRELRALVDRRRELIETRTAEKNRRKTAAKEIIDSIDEHIDWLDQQLEKLDERMDSHIAKRNDLYELNQRLQQVPGVGPITGLTLLVYLPELGDLNRKQIAALVGLAPFARDSGLSRGRRIVWGGRAQARSMLFMAAMAASRHNRPMASFYQRLIDAGKTKKAALTAVARKLLTIINAMVRDNRPWIPDFQPGCC